MGSSSAWATYLPFSVLTKGSCDSELDHWGCGEMVLGSTTWRCWISSVRLLSLVLAAAVRGQIKIWRVGDVESVLLNSESDVDHGSEFGGHKLLPVGRLVFCLKIANGVFQNPGIVEL